MNDKVVPITEKSISKSTKAPEKSLEAGKERGMMEFCTLPKRSAKPRNIGLTHVIDKGIGLRQVEDLLETASDHIDILKLGWGTGYVTQNVLDKIKLYQSAGIPVCFGGTLLELAILQGKFDDFRAMLHRSGVTHAEISNGVINLEPEEKRKYIRKLKDDGFKVLAEVGSKASDKVIAPYRWVELIKADIDAGAWKVICEARESGTVGLYFGTGEIRSGLIDEILDGVGGPDHLIFEAPQKTQQVWLVQKFGSEVNLGNIATGEVIALETLRLGLRADTMAYFHDVDGWNEAHPEKSDNKPAPPKTQYLS